jgi:AcrR family transcriptional regulator
MVKEKGKKGALSKGDRREDILVAATTLFAERGMLGVRMTDIARQAGVQPPHIAYYFPTPEDLQFEVILRTLENLKKFALERSSVAEGSAWAKLEGYTRAFFLWTIERRPLFQLWMQFYTLATIDPKYRKINTEIRRVGRERIRMMVYEGIEKEEFKLHAPVWKAEDAAILIQAIITGQVIQSGTEDGDLPPERFEDSAVKTIAEILGYRREWSKN